MHDLLPDGLQPPPRPPLGFLPEPRRARVLGVSTAHHEEMGGHLAPPASSLGSTGLGPRGRCHRAPLVDACISEAVKVATCMDFREDEMEEERLRLPARMKGGGIKNRQTYGDRVSWGR